MSTLDGRWTLVLNGEIYNHVELREELKRLGRRFHSHNDTEVLLEALAQWDVEALPRLEGMFAFAAYDRDRHRLLLARDPFGMKPLFYALSGRSLVFASEIPAILEFGGVSRRINAHRLYDFLTTSNTDHGCETLFADMRQVQAAHYLEVLLADPTQRRETPYWSLDLARDADWSFEDAAERVRHAFLRSIQLHLRSDVPLGFALSGGIDSSAVVMSARAALGPGATLDTFSFIPEDPRINEEEHIDFVAGAANAVVHKLRLTSDDLKRDIGALSLSQGEPFASPVIYAQYRVMRLASEAGMKVMLGGQGADEILAGYDRYLAARAASLMRRGRVFQALRSLRRPVTPYLGGSMAALGRASVYALPFDVASALRRLIRRRRVAWLDHEWFRKRGVAAAPAWAARGNNVMREMLGHNLLESQIQALLRYEDRNAMAFSLENRVPFLTPRLVELLFRLPEEHLLAADGTRKAVFRRAMRGIVPDRVLDRRDKIGFSVPILQWFEALRPWISQRLALAARLPGLVPARV